MFNCDQTIIQLTNPQFNSDLFHNQKWKDMPKNCSKWRGDLNARQPRNLAILCNIRKYNVMMFIECVSSSIFSNTTPN